MYKKLLAVTAVFALSVPVSGTEADGTDLTAEQQANLSRMLDGRTAGRPKSCIRRGELKSITVVGDDTVVFRSSDDAKTIYVNNSIKNCAGLAGNKIQFNRHKAHTCKGDKASILDAKNKRRYSNGPRHAKCAFGKFVPYTKSDN